MELLILIGIFTCPIFTLACVLMCFDYPFLGFIALMYSFFKGDKEREKRYENQYKKRQYD